MTDTAHGSTEHYDEGCRAPVCVHAHRTRIVEATRVELTHVVSTIITQPDPPLVVQPDPEIIDHLECEFCGMLADVLVEGVPYCADHADQVMEADL